MFDKPGYAHSSEIDCFKINIPSEKLLTCQTDPIESWGITFELTPGLTEKFPKTERPVSV